MKSILFILCFSVCIPAVYAQSKKPKLKHYFLTQAALLNGDRSVSGQAQLTTGIEKKNGWKFGLGTGLDFYKVRTVPVFADVRFAFGKNRRYFSYTDLGANFVWALESQYVYHWSAGMNTRAAFGTGLYGDIGFGYALGGEKKGGLLMSFGYSVKTLSIRYDETVYKEFPPYGIEYREHKLNYTLNRLVLRMGVRL